MRRLVLVVSVVLALLSVGQASSGSALRVFHQVPRLAKKSGLSGATFRNLRVCAYEHFSLKLQQCTADERNTPLLSSRLVCSALMSLSRPTTVTAQWIYAGTPMEPSRGVYDAGTTRMWLKLDSGQPDGPLPGGHLSCSLKAGNKRVTAAFTSSGPKGPVVDITVCAATDVFMYDGFPVCKKDESAGVNSSECITVDAIFVDGAGEKARIDWGIPRQPTTLGEQGDAKFLDDAIIQRYRTGACKLIPGTFEVRFLLNRVQVAVKTFVVTSNQ